MNKTLELILKIIPQLKELELQPEVAVIIILILFIFLAKSLKN
jgi:hypothetical protein